MPNEPSLHNGEMCPLHAVPLLPFDEFRSAVVNSVNTGARLAAFFGRPSPRTGVRLYAVTAHADSATLAVLAADVSDSFASLTPACAQAHCFEREIAEQWGLIPQGHPWLKPLRFHSCYSPERDAWGRAKNTEIVPGDLEYYRVEGDEVHEVAVGPVHAGVIEPGHFRFQCHGENVMHLEISLGYQHRGIERMLVGGPNKRTIHYMETLAGDTSIGHASAYCQALEALAGVRLSARSQVLRAVALELERLANHTGDLGALAGDIGFLPTASFCGRLRGDFLNLTAALCGSRFGRGFVRPGGVGFDVDEALLCSIRKGLQGALKDVTSAVKLLWSAPSVMARFEEAGTLSRADCLALGMVGPAARACGLERDVRFEFPFGIFKFAHIPISTWDTGDVLGRAYVRWLEIQRSAAFIEEQFQHLPAAETQPQIQALAPESLVVSLVEGWRGEICHVALTDEQGRFARYKIVDPSFHNWMGLAVALRGQQISDFPLCNKSFNLSYCGHDL